MARMNRIHLGWIFLSLISLVSCGDFCADEDGDVEYCHSGCCSNGCCKMSVMTIVGIVIGGLLFLASLVCLAACIYFMCKNRNGRKSQTVQPAHNSNSVYVNNSAYGHPPPSYNQYSNSNSYSHPPPAYSDPAYPPGTVNSGYNSSGFKT